MTCLEVGWIAVLAFGAGLFVAYGIVRFWIWWYTPTGTDAQNYQSPSIRDNVRRTR